MKYVHDGIVLDEGEQEVYDLFVGALDIGLNTPQAIANVRHKYPDTSETFLNYLRDYPPNKTGDELRFMEEEYLKTLA